MLTDVSVVFSASVIIVLIMEAVLTSETSLNIYQTTQHSISEDSHILDSCALGRLGTGDGLL
jgi:hypothetical protein